MFFIGSHGIGLAIPIDTAVQIIDQLLSNKCVVRPYIGMTVKNYNERTKMLLHTADSNFEILADPISVIVTAVATDSPAARAGIRM